MKTKLLLLSLLLLTITACTLPPIEDANPLDRPYDLESAKSLEESNVRIITGNPGWMSRPER